MNRSLRVGDVVVFEEKKNAPFRIVTNKRKPGEICMVDVLDAEKKPLKIKGTPMRIYRAGDKIVLAEHPGITFTIRSFNGAFMVLGFKTLELQFPILANINSHTPCEKIRVGCSLIFADVPDIVYEVVAIEGRTMKLANFLNSDIKAERDIDDPWTDMWQYFDEYDE